jgi:general secretion pathway protein G
MQKFFCRLLIAFLTFVSGLVCTSYYRDYQFERAQTLGQEARLRRRLFTIRRSLDEYAADRGELPQSLDDLMNAEYIVEVPFDPITSRRTWMIVVGNDPNSLKGNQGIIDVHSTSSAISSEGSAYSEW